MYRIAAGIACSASDLYVGSSASEERPLIRRHFLKMTGSAAATGWAVAARGSQAPLVETAQGPVPGILDIGSKKQLFLDDMLIAHSSRVSRFMGRPRKYPQNPVLTTDKPWENQDPQVAKLPLEGIQISGQAVLYDEEEKIFKMWYNPWSFFPPQTSTLVLCQFPRMGIAGRSLNSGSTATRVPKITTFWGLQQIQVLQRVQRQTETDPQKRYKAMGEVEERQGNGTAVAFSPDGLNWTEFPAIR